MSRKPEKELRRGWTTGACATAAVKAALEALWGGGFPAQVSITLPKGETPVFELAYKGSGTGWAEAGIIKDAGDDPDVTHGAMIRARVKPMGKGIRFMAGDGVGTVTKAGLPIEVGEPAINPVPRQMMRDIVLEAAQKYGHTADVEITITIPNGDVLAAKTWNPRLGIKGGLSVLGTTGIVRPFSCSAWIASIHRGIDVARANGVEHVAGCTGATSETAVQAHCNLPDHAMLDMGDFAGGLIKYLKKHPVKHLTIGGGIGKLTKLAQGAVDLHSSRSVVDFEVLNAWSLAAGLADVSQANTALDALQIAGGELAQVVAIKAKKRAAKLIGDEVTIDVILVDRQGKILADTGLS